LIEEDIMPDYKVGDRVECTTDYGKKYKGEIIHDGIGNLWDMPVVKLDGKETPSYFRKENIIKI
jgi:hypothetical protein